MSSKMGYLGLEYHKFGPIGSQPSTLGPRPLQRRLGMSSQDRAANYDA